MVFTVQRVFLAKDCHFSKVFRARQTFETRLVIVVQLTFGLHCLTNDLKTTRATGTLTIVFSNSHTAAAAAANFPTSKIGLFGRATCLNEKSCRIILMAHVKEWP
jgi:hypothetical protein